MSVSIRRSLIINLIYYNLETMEEITYAGPLVNNLKHKQHISE
jgi:hypothetical protein